jgi:uncharacterized membrane protein
MNRVATIPASVGAFLLLGSIAQADIVVCNDFHAPIHVALAYGDQDSFTAAGWWSAEPNGCQAVDFNFKGTTLYYAANSDPYKEGRSTKHDHWGNKLKLFVSNQKFNSDHADRSRRGTRVEMFSSADISQSASGKVPKITLRFHSGGTTINVASGK